MTSIPTKQPPQQVLKMARKNIVFDPVRNQTPLHAQSKGPSNQTSDGVKLEQEPEPDTTVQRIAHDPEKNQQRRPGHLGREYKVTAKLAPAGPRVKKAYTDLTRSVQQAKRNATLRIEENWNCKIEDALPKRIIPRKVGKGGRAVKAVGDSPNVEIENPSEWSKRLLERLGWLSVMTKNAHRHAVHLMVDEVANRRRTAVDYTANIPEILYSDIDHILETERVKEVSNAAAGLPSNSSLRDSDPDPSLDSDLDSDSDLDLDETTAFKMHLRKDKKEFSMPQYPPSDLFSAFGGKDEDSFHLTKVFASEVYDLIAENRQIHSSRRNHKLLVGRIRPNRRRRSLDDDGDNNSY